MRGIKEYESPEEAIKAAIESAEKNKAALATKVLNCLEMIKASLEDEEIGGSERKLAESFHHCRMAIDHYQCESCLDALYEVNMHVHPEVIRFFSRVGRSLCSHCQGKHLSPTQQGAKA